MELTKGKLIDYISYSIAIIGIILSFQAVITGMLTVEQAAAASAIFTTISQIGSILGIAKDNLTSDNIIEEDSESA
jgi:hypothetical protein